MSQAAGDFKKNFSENRTGGAKHSSNAALKRKLSMSNLASK
jgi:hypothetical protein